MSDLGIGFLLTTIKDSLECRLREPALDSGFLILLISHTEPLRPVIKGIAKWLMGTFQCVLSSHEDLGKEIVSNSVTRTFIWRKVALFRKQSSKLEDA